MKHASPVAALVLLACLFVLRVVAVQGEQSPGVSVGLYPDVSRHAWNGTAHAAGGESMCSSLLFRVADESPGVRFTHTATLLPDGRVLVAGGLDEFNDVLSALVYDPANETFGPIPMVQPRHYHTATPLGQGKVLIAGGSERDWGAHSDDPPLVAAELYDHAARRFTSVGNLVNPRTHHTATRLPSGQVLMAGGWGAGAIALSSAELYDPAGEEFVPVSDMHHERTRHTATLLGNGQVLIAGGTDARTAPYGLAVAESELYDSQTAAFVITGSLHEPRSGHTATRLADGRVLIAGGQTAPNHEVATLEIYDPATGAFTQAGRMFFPRVEHTATLLPDGRVLLAGGINWAGETASAELFDPESNTIVATGQKNYPTIHHTATLLPDARVLFFGGYDIDRSMPGAEFFRYSSHACSYLSFIRKAPPTATPTATPTRTPTVTPTRTPTATRTPVAAQPAPPP